MIPLDKNIWKKFEEVELTHSSVHHLMAIYDLRKTQGYARSVDVANYLNISMGSTSITLHKLEDKGLILKENKKFLSLSDEAHELINEIISVRKALKLFYCDVLKLPEELAEEEACKSEHLLNRKTAETLISFIGYLLSDDPASKMFRERFGTFIYKCNPETGCEFCEEECFFACD